MHAAEAEARARQIASVGLAVGLDDGYAPARQLYASLGYRDPGLGTFIESAAIPSDDPQPGIWLDVLVLLVKSLGG